MLWLYTATTCAAVKRNDNNENQHNVTMQEGKLALIQNVCLVTVECKAKQKPDCRAKNKL